MTVRRRLSGTSFIRASYVFSKSLDVSSNTGGVVAANFPTAQNPYNLNQERGRSDFDVRQAFLASFIWAPKFTNNLVLRGWQVSGTTTAYTGAPFTPKVANFDITTGGAARPDRVANGAIANPSPDAWFDRSAFPVVPLRAFRYGSSGRNIFNGPGTFNLNTGLSRRFRFSDTKALQFRAEAFNITNRTNFNMPTTQVDIQSGSSITAAKSPRQMQLALRLEF